MPCAIVDVPDRWELASTIFSGHAARHLSLFSIGCSGDVRVVPVRSDYRRPYSPPPAASSISRQLPSESSCCYCSSPSASAAFPRRPPLLPLFVLFGNFRFSSATAAFSSVSSCCNCWAFALRHHYRCRSDLPHFSFFYFPEAHWFVVSSNPDPVCWGRVFLPLSLLAEIIVTGWLCHLRPLLFSSSGVCSGDGRWPSTPDHLRLSSQAEPFAAGGSVLVPVHTTPSLQFKVGAFVILEREVGRQGSHGSSSAPSWSSPPPSSPFPTSFLVVAGVTVIKSVFGESLLELDESAATSSSTIPCVGFGYCRCHRRLRAAGFSFVVFKSSDGRRRFARIVAVMGN